MERTLTVSAEALYCQAEHMVPELATHSVTDAKQTVGGWEETAPRHGCKEHPVAPNVILLDGTVVPFSEYKHDS